VCFDENLVTTLRVLLVLQRMSDCGEISSQLATPLLKSLLDFCTIALKFGTSWQHRHEILSEICFERNLVQAGNALYFILLEKNGEL
jgi:hypothetical protein